MFYEWFFLAALKSFADISKQKIMKRKIYTKNEEKNNKTLKITITMTQQ
jgi:hypothetical protein